MNIAIDARWIFPEISGIGAYTRELVRHLALIDRENAYLLIFDNASVRDRTLEETGLVRAPNFTAQLVSWSVFSIASQLRMPAFLKMQNIDVFHSTNYMIPFLAFPHTSSRRTRCVVTIHDVIPMLFRSRVRRSLKARFYPVFRAIMLDVARRADAIITDSNASKTDIVRCLNIPDSARVKPVYCGVSERFRPSGGRPSTAPTRPRTLLYVGRADPYKNLLTLVQALPDIRRRCPFPVTLTVAGSPDPRYPEAQQLTARLGLQDDVRWTGYLADKTLIAEYQKADILVHPSLYEGFGLQVVEAMACGTPVVCSNAASLPEVAGNAARLVPPEDTAALSSAVVEVLTQPALADDMRQKGIRQSSLFTWTRTARETLAVYREVYA